MNLLDRLLRFRSTLPVVRDWIERTLEDHKAEAVPVISFGYRRLEEVYPVDLQSKAKAVVVAGKVPFPPLSRMGLPEFSPMEKMDKAGITFLDTFFVNRRDQTESLFFHELVHVVQWERLGMDNFLTAYAFGVMQSGYRQSPLEKMAYFLQDNFNRGALPMDVMERIHRETDAIWKDVLGLISKGDITFN